MGRHKATDIIQIMSGENWRRNLTKKVEECERRHEKRMSRGVKITRLK